MDFFLLADDETSLGLLLHATLPFAIFYFVKFPLTHSALLRVSLTLTLRKIRSNSDCNFRCRSSRLYRPFIKKKKSFRDFSLLADDETVLLGGVKRQFRNFLQDFVFCKLLQPLPPRARTLTATFVAGVLVSIVLSLKKEVLSGLLFISGRRDSNSRQPAWKADALPTELHPHYYIQF